MWSASSAGYACSGAAWTLWTAYMAPEPHRGERNSSLFIPYVVEKIAELKGITTEEVERVTYRNAETLFHAKRDNSGVSAQ